jgi:hypothetical protein
MKLCTLLLFCSSLSFGSERLWQASIMAHGGATAFDAASSWNRLERNPLLGERFRWQGVTIKSAAFVGTFALQRRTGPRYKKVWTVFNFAAAGMYTVFAVRNLKSR